MFKVRESLTDELRMLPRDTKKRILENVKRRRNEIIEEKLLEQQLKEINKAGSSEPKKWSMVREGMQRRREELRKQGILKPLIRYDKKNFRSPLEEMSQKARADEIKRLEDQRNKLKAGYGIGMKPGMKLKTLKLKIPKSSGMLIKKKGGLGDGII